MPENALKPSFSPTETENVINCSQKIQKMVRAPDEGALLYEYDYMNDDIVIEGEVYV